MEKSELEPRPAVVLVRPQLGENIGAAARAMWNCGLDDLRLVAPRDGWPNEKAVAAATGASWIVERARVFDTTREAVADLQLLYATTARRRDLIKPVVGPDEAATALHRRASEGERGGFLFGPERTGLDNDDLSLASAVLQVPLNPEFSSLNLAQAVLLVSWEWYRGRGESASVSGRRTRGRRDQRATAEELTNFFEHLEQELETTGFLRIAEKREVMMRNLRALFQRADLRQHEVQSLHGVISHLTGRRKDGSPVRSPRSRKA